MIMAPKLPGSSRENREIEPAGHRTGGAGLTSRHIWDSFCCMKGRLNGWRWRGAGVGLFLAIVLSLGGCTTVPETGRRAFTIMPESQMTSMGANAFAEVKRSSPLITSGERYEMIQRVGHRLARVVAVDMPNGAWEFIYIDEAQVNAWAMPGGKIAVYDGLFKVVEDENELAFILGHEIAHVTARHANQRISQGILVAAGGVGLDQAMRNRSSADRNLILALYGVGTTVGVMLPYSRSHESEADYIGLLYMARAGYDPRVAPAVWGKMARESRGGPPEWLSTHPSHYRREEDLRNAMPVAMEEYRRALAADGRSL